MCVGLWPDCGRSDQHPSRGDPPQWPKNRHPKLEQNPSKLSIGAIDVAESCKFIKIGAVDVTEPYKIIKLGAIDVTKPYEFIGFGAIDVTKPDPKGQSGAPSPQVLTGGASQLRSTLC
jgi:hypothetical protein